MIFNLTDQQTDQILNALATRPYMEVAPIIQELVQQVQAQKQPQVPGFAAALNGAAEVQQRSQ